MAENPSAPVGHGSGTPGKGVGMLKNKKVAIGFGIFLVLGIVFVAIHSANKNNNAAAQQSAGGQTAVDPATGYPFGSMADSNALGGGFFPGSSGSGSGSSTVPPISVTVNNPPPVSTQPAPVGSKPPSKPPTHHQPPPHHHSNTYVVKPGDNLSEIAARFHISGGWHTLYNLNKHTIGGNPNLIHPGQKLTL
jgi:nucleoid-associated protein YgaU